jgi:hypothetical protein
VDVVFAGTLHNRRVPLPRGMRFGVELIELATVPQTLGIIDDKARRAQIERHRVGGIGLEFDRIRTRSRSGINNRESSVERLIVVAGHFGNQIRLFTRPNRAITNPKPCRLHALITFSNMAISVHRQRLSETRAPFIARALEQGL